VARHSKKSIGFNQSKKNFVATSKFQKMMKTLQNNLNDIITTAWQGATNSICYRTS